MKVENRKYLQETISSADFSELQKRGPETERMTSENFLCIDVLKKSFLDLIFYLDH